MRRLVIVNFVAKQPPKDWKTAEYPPNVKLARGDQYPVYTKLYLAIPRGGEWQRATNRRIGRKKKVTLQDVCEQATYAGPLFQMWLNFSRQGLWMERGRKQRGFTYYARRLFSPPHFNYGEVVKFPIQARKQSHLTLVDDTKLSYSWWASESRRSTFPISPWTVIESSGSSSLFSYLSCPSQIPSLLWTTIWRVSSNSCIVDHPRRRKRKEAEVDVGIITIRRYDKSLQYWYL